MNLLVKSNNSIPEFISVIIERPLAKRRAHESGSQFEKQQQNKSENWQKNVTSLDACQSSCSVFLFSLDSFWNTVFYGEDIL
jgi:hypothetical protein